LTAAWQGIAGRTAAVVSGAQILRAVVQRVSRAKVSIAGEMAGAIEGGFLVLLGVADGDTREDALFLARKIAELRVFEDDLGKMNRALADVGGKMLVVSQFTLLGDCRNGRRPSFGRAARPEIARDLYEAFVAAVRDLGIESATGRFQEMMQVELVNEGPVTLLLDSRREF
jgi:D-tyrosyl-tRNA(Tyr) deacylase